MKTAKSALRSVAVTAIVSCPLCRDHGPSSRGTISATRLLEYKPIYLCEAHRDAWAVADSRARAREAVVARTRTQQTEKTNREER